MEKQLRMKSKTQRSSKMIESRARFGEQQRDKSRNMIVDAALRVFQTKAPEAAVIGDFIVEAGVARGTFYNHFNDVEELLSAVALRLSDNFNGMIRDAYIDIDDPAQRVAIAARHFIRRTMREPNWAWVIVRVALHGPLDNLLRESMAPDLADGLSAGRFLGITGETCADVIMGSTLAAMRTVLTSNVPETHAEDVAAAILRALGLSPQEASDIAAQQLPILKE